MRPTLCIALLRGINVGGRNKLPMAQLRSLCEEVGWTDVRSYIQSGNLIFRSTDSAGVLEARLGAAIERHAGFTIPVIVRRAADWQGYLDSNPFPEAAQREPNLVMLAVSKKPPAEGAAEVLMQRAAAGESVVQKDDMLWIHYAGGAGRSKITPGLLDRHVGSPVTTRNWRTVLRLAEMARQAE